MENNSEIQRFYRNKKVFITGGTGYLGKVFIEKLLRVTDVNRIYILVRQKNEKNIYQRIEDMFKDPLYDRLKTQMPKPWNQIVPILGDCSLPQLGISDKDRNDLIDNVHIVVHCAATIRFNEPLNVALKINTSATIYMIELAKNLKQLEAFIHVSTLYVKCIQKHIDEQICTNVINMSSMEICKLLFDLRQDQIVNIFSGPLKNYPNTYCFTKALGEQLIQELGKGLPIIVFRPSVVLPTWKEPVPGWSDNTNGPLMILQGVAYGILRVVYGNLEGKAIVVPVDLCVNLMLASGWKVTRSLNNLSPQIYNIGPCEDNSITWTRFYDAIEMYGPEMPLNQMLFLPIFHVTTSKFWFTILCFFYHTLPSIIIDLLTLLKGRKAKMLKLYNRINRNASTLEFFTRYNWTVDMHNTNKLWASLSLRDQQLFSFDMKSLDWYDYTRTTLYGLRIYVAKEDPKSIPKAVQRLKRFQLQFRYIKLFIYAIIIVVILITVWIVVGFELIE